MNNFIKKIQAFFILSRKWTQLKNDLLYDYSMPDSKEIILKIVEWALEIEKIDNRHIQDAYNSHLKYFTELNLEDDVFKTSKQQARSLINFFCRKKFEQHTNVCANVASLLQNLIVFRSNSACPKCKNDMFVYEHKEKEEILYFCEYCLLYFTEDMNQKYIENRNTLSPISSSDIKDNNFQFSDIDFENTYYFDQEHIDRKRDLILYISSKYISFTIFPYILIILIHFIISEQYTGIYSKGFHFASSLFIPLIGFILSSISLVFLFVTRISRVPYYVAIIIADLWLPTLLCLLDAAAGEGSSEKMGFGLAAISIFFIFLSHILYISIKFISKYREGI